MAYDIPDNLDLNSLGSDSTPAPGNDGLPTNTTQAPVSDLGYDPNMMIKYKASGRDLSEPLSTIITRAQRGYDYAQLVNQHKQQSEQQLQELQARQQQIAQWESQWKPYHEFASQNPSWADHVKQMWEQRFNPQGQSIQQELAQGQQQQQQQSHFSLPPQVQSELAEMRQFISDMKEQQRAAQQAQQDQALAQEIESIRKQYPDIDFAHTDPETGESLEMKIIRHAQENRIHNFNAAFKDFYFDKLMERAVMNAKDSLAKQIQSQNKQGFLAKSDSSMLQAGNLPPNSRSMSYHQLMDLAAKEMGLN